MARAPADRGGIWRREVERMLAKWDAACRRSAPARPWSPSRPALTLAVVALLGTTLAAQSAPTHTYYAYVCAESDDQVALVRFGPDGADVVKTISVGSFPAETEGPHGINVSPDGRHWFVSLAHGFPFGSVHKYATETDEWLGDTTLDMFPATLTVSPTTGLMFVVNFNLHGPMEPSSVSVVETRTMTEVARIDTGVMPHGSRLSADGAKHYSVTMMGGELIEIDALRFEVSRRLALSEQVASAHDSHDRGVVPGATQAATIQPTWVSAPTAAGTIYVAGNNHDVVVEVDLDRWAVTRRFEDAGAGPYNLDVTPDGEVLVVTYKRGAAVGFWDLARGVETGRVATLRTVPHGVAITPDGRYAFVSVEGVGGEPGGVEIFDVHSSVRVGDVEIGKQAGGVAIWKIEP